MIQRLLIVLAAVLLGAFSIPPSAVGDDGDEPGSVEVDQSAVSTDETTSSPAAPQPMSPLGPALPGTYSTEEWDSGETDTSTGLLVVSSTALGTSALTGVVQDEDTQAPIANASVAMACVHCNSFVETTTDANGAFAFIDMPADIYDLIVMASGYGQFSLLNGLYRTDSQYQISVELNGTAQSEDESVAASDVDQEGAPDSPAPIGRHRRVPPSLRVSRVNRSAACNFISEPNPLNVRRYSWPFYVLHVLPQEVGGLNYNQAAMKSFEALVQNYAWHHVLQDHPQGFDVDDSTRYQCFRPRWKVPRLARGYLIDVLDERIAGLTGHIRITEYRDGNPLNVQCDEDPEYPRDGNLGSQYGIKSLSTLFTCGPITDWRLIDEYYFTWTVQTGTAPPNPQTSFSRFPGGITFTFQSISGGALLGWRYEVERLRNTGWALVHISRWSPTQRIVPTTWSYTTTGCSKYRVRARNPVGYSLYSSFNGGNAICPG